MSAHRFPESPVFYRSLGRTFPEIVRAEGIYLHDSLGKRYMDGAGGAVVVNIGHGRREMAEAMAEQARRVAYVHGTQFTTRAVEEASALLTEVLPRGLDKVYTVSGGSEAIETAIKLARQYQLACGDSGRYRIIGRWPSYHGNTIGALSVSGRASLRRPYQPLLTSMLHVPAPYCYRCPLGATYPDCGVACADALESLVRQEGADSIAAFLAEPIIGASAGAAVPPPEYFPRVRDICDRYGLLLIADEVMTGLGRTGRFFAVEHFGIVPDMIVMGKGLSGGYVPAGAVAVKTAVVDTIRQRFGNFTHGFTFSHHPVVAAACREALSILKQEELVARVEARGKRLFEKLRQIETLPFVGDIRGRGLMGAVEFVADRKTRMPFPRSRRFAEAVFEKALEKGLVVYPSTAIADGVDGDLVMLAPPFIIKDHEIDEMVTLLGEALSEVYP